MSLQSQAVGTAGAEEQDDPGLVVCEGDNDQLHTDPIQ